jgi:hypothetical protein
MTKVLGAVTVAMALLLLPATPAQASCAASPEPSPHRFVGTVVEVDADGRLAHVRLDDGSRVEVHGSPSLADGSGTSVDRHFTVGGRYEFHPTNERSPFEDNACTATRQLSGPTVPPDSHDDDLPGWLGGGAVLATLAAAAFTIVRRFRP